MLFSALPALLLATSAHGSSPLHLTLWRTLEYVRLTYIAALSILYPNTDTTWFKNNTVALNWTRTDPTTDTYFFRTFLGNKDTGLLATNQSLADSSKLTNNLSYDHSWQLELGRRLI